MIRDATPADLDDVAALIRALADYEELAHEVEWDLELLAETLFGPDAVPRTLVAVDDATDGVVGIAIWFPTYSTFQARSGIWLEDLFVRPEHRGAGHGRALLQALFDRAGSGRVEWAVLDWNKPAIDFYESLGAEAQSEWVKYRLTGDALQALAKQCDSDLP